MSLPVRRCNSFLLLGGWCFHDCLNLIRANLYPPLADHKPQEFVSAYAKGAFRRIQLHAILPQEVENFLQVEDMLLSGFAFNHDIVKIGRAHV